MMNNVSEFFKNNLGFIIGLLLGIVVVACRITDFVLDVVVIVLFAFLGGYVQRNKTKVKVDLKNFIDKM